MEHIISVVISALQVTFTYFGCPPTYVDFNEFDCIAGKCIVFEVESAEMCGGNAFTEHEVIAATQNVDLVHAWLNDSEFKVVEAPQIHPNPLPRKKIFVPFF